MGCLRLLGDTNPPMVMPSSRLKCHQKKCAGCAVYGVRNVRYDKVTGALVGEVALPANANGAPMTYMAGGRQYIVMAVGGANLPAELVALRLP